MRAVLAVSLALALLIVPCAVEAKPFPQTRGAVREAMHDTLQEGDAAAASLLREARAVVKEARREAGAIAFPALPTLPQNSPLEVRAVMVQPGLQGQDEVLAVLWIGAKSGQWTGAYWVQSEDGMVTPNLLDVNEEGLLLFMYGGSLSRDDEITGASYHFLGVDGTHVVQRLEPILLLPGVPVLGRAAIAGADASARGAAPEALLVAPWNLLGENATLGMTLYAGDAPRDEVVLVGCEDPTATQTEAGCRLLYVLELASDVTRLELWHVDAEGSRVVDESHERLALLGGITYAG